MRIKCNASECEINKRLKYAFRFGRSIEFRCCSFYHSFIFLSSTFWGYFFTFYSFIINAIFYITYENLLTMKAWFSSEWRLQTKMCFHHVWSSEIYLSNVYDNAQYYVCISYLCSICCRKGSIIMGSCILPTHDYSSMSVYSIHICRK